MPIHYVLFENNLTSDPGDYTALVQPTGTADLEAVIGRMIQRGSTASPGKRFRKAIRERAQATKQEAVRPRPNPLEYTDVNSGERNSVLTPGGMGRVVGHRFKFDPADANQGIFFVAEGGGALRATLTVS